MQGYGDGRSGEARVISPASRYAHPRAVVDDPTLSIHQKRSILSHWVSDACAVESDPTMRLAPGSTRPAKVGDIFAALAALDAPPPPSPPRGPAVLRRPPTPPAPVPMPAMAVAGA